jgi:uncharacterized membrane protein YesL
MRTGTFTSFAYWLTDRISKLALINVLWIFFSITGLLIFGVFPATIAMFSVVRLILKKEQFPIIKTFWRYFKQEFFKSNGIGWIITTIAIIFTLEINFIEVSGNSFMQLFYYPLIILNIIFYLTVLYLLPTYVHFEMGLLDLFKNSLLIMIVNPLATIYMIAGFIVNYVALIYMPAILFFFSGSMLTLLITSVTSLAIQRVEKKRMNLNEVSASN